MERDLVELDGGGKFLRPTSHGPNSRYVLHPNLFAAMLIEVESRMLPLGATEVTLAEH